MARNGASIAKFVSKHYNFMSDVVRLINSGEGDSFIKKNELEILAERYGAPVDDLLKLRIGKFDEESSGYVIDRRVTGFISFCSNEFALSSPEAVKKYHFSLMALYEKSIRAEEVNDIVRYADQMITELIDFSDMLESNTQRLLDDTLTLKSEHEKMSAAQRFDQASKLIDEYITPLKEMVEDREDTILPLIRSIMSMATHRLVSFDKNIDSKMHRLASRANGTHADIERFGKKILSELYTLRKIRRNSQILSNAVAWLTDKESLPSSRLLPSFNRTTHSKEFFYEAIEMFDDILAANETVMISEKAMHSSAKGKEEHFRFKEAEYFEKLAADMPVDDFFSWLYRAMQERGELSHPNYCTALSLMDHTQLKFSDERCLLDFEDFNLNAPVSAVKKIEKDRK